VLGRVSDLSLREARRLAEQILRPINAGCWRPQSMLTLHDFYSRHYGPDVLPNLKRSTQSSYRANINHHILPALGDLCLLELSRSDTQRFVTALAGKGLERQTIKNVWTTLSAALTAAVEYGYWERNPARGIKVAVRQPAKVRFIPSPSKFADLTGCLAEPARTICLLLAGTGMRIGEAMALRVEDVDLQNLEIRVSQDISHGHLDTPKSNASAATLPIGPKLASALGQHMVHLGRSAGFLFANELGRPLDPIHLARKFLYPAQHSPNCRGFRGTRCDTSTPIGSELMMHRFELLNRGCDTATPQ